MLIRDLSTHFGQRPEAGAAQETAGGAAQADASGAETGSLGDVSGFLDAYMGRCVKPAGLRSIGSGRSRISVLKEALGTLPLAEIEVPDEINRFKTESDYADEVELATVHRALETLRAAINWGMAQTPPLLNKSPFHRFGVRLQKKVETTRNRRLSREEERKLRDTALQSMNTAEHGGEADEIVRLTENGILRARDDLDLEFACAAA